MEAPPVAAAVTLKLPPFWPADPQIWFAQVEAQFGTRNITSQKTRFEYVVASLSPEFAQEVRDLILKPPDATPYDTLKKALVERTAASEQRRLQLLFNSEELGDRKPTQLLRRMQQLLGDKAGATDASFLRELFLQRLPPNVRMVLASTDTTELEKLAQLADKIVEVATPPVSTVTSSSEYEQLRTEMADLRKLVESLHIPVSTQRNRQRSSSRGRTPRRSRASTPTNTEASDDLCWYHRRFGDTARKCRTPCSMSENAQASH